jgi:hypothetical protein
MWRDSLKLSPHISFDDGPGGVDISRIKYWQETQIFLDEVYESKIKPLLKIKKAG